MESLHRTVKRGVSAGEPLADPFQAFEDAKITFRRGAISMIAGPPGSMKSVLALNIVKNLKVPTLYHSSDSDSFTMAARSLSMVTGKSNEESELMVLGQSEEAYESLKEMEHTRWAFTSSPTMDDLEHEADAYCEMYGEYPHLTVLDIMMDVNCEGAAEQNYWGLMADLKDMARAHETALVVVHHTSESAKAGSPPPRSAIMGKANQLPALILTLWGDSKEGTIDVATVKNRFGPQDPMARTWLTLKADPSVCQVRDFAEGEARTNVLFHDGATVPEEKKVDVFAD
jgi:KaiC/GvpD/RAD55 family RecA-like ATPase